MNCPVCNKEMDHYQEVLDGWCLMEESYNCPDKHYGYQYVTGYISEYIGDKEFFTDCYNYESLNLMERVDIKIQRLLLRLEILITKIKNKDIDNDKK